MVLNYLTASEGGGGGGGGGDLGVSGFKGFLVSDLFIKKKIKKKKIQQIQIC